MDYFHEIYSSRCSRHKALEVSFESNTTVSILSHLCSGKKKKKAQISVGESGPCPAALCSILMPSASCVALNSSPGNLLLFGTYSPITSAISQALLAGLCVCMCKSVHLCMCSSWSPLWCLFDVILVLLRANTACLTWLWKKVCVSVCVCRLTVEIWRLFFLLQTALWQVALSNTCATQCLKDLCSLLSLSVCLPLLLTASLFFLFFTTATTLLCYFNQTYLIDCPSVSLFHC